MNPQGLQQGQSLTPRVIDAVDLSCTGCVGRQLARDEPQAGTAGNVAFATTQTRRACFLRRKHERLKTTNSVSSPQTKCWAALTRPDLQPRMIRSD